MSCLPRRRYFNTIFCEGSSLLSRGSRRGSQRRGRWPGRDGVVGSRSLRDERNSPGITRVPRPAPPRPPTPLPDKRKLRLGAGFLVLESVPASSASPGVALPLAPSAPHAAPQAGNARRGVAVFSVSLGRGCLTWRGRGGRGRRGAQAGCAARAGWRVDRSAGTGADPGGGAALSSSTASSSERWIL